MDSESRQPGKAKRTLNKIIGIWMWLFLCFCAGCGEIVFTKGFGENEIFQVGETGCTAPEIMVYLLSTRGQYEKAYGDGIWTAKLEDSSLEEEVKELVLEKAAQIKTMYLMALANELSLSEEEQKSCQDAASQYTKAMDDETCAQLGITQPLVQAMYEEYALAEKVYNLILSDVTPEISDDEARIVTVQHVLIRTYEKNASGQKVSFSPERKEQAYEKAKQVWQEATDGSHEFAELASKYSDDATLQYSFSKGEMDAAFEKAAFNLGTGDISDVVESESGYHIIKCIETLDRERTDANKLTMMETRRNEVFGREYDAFVEKLARRVNTPLWETISFLDVQAKSLPNFFDIYEKCL